MERFLVLVQMAHERDEAALEIERTFTIGPVVEEADPEALVQVGGLAESLGYRVEAELYGLEHLGIGQERGGSPLPVTLRPYLLDGHRGHAAGVLLSPDRSVARGFHSEPHGQRVDHAHANAVQATGNLVAAASELGARVQHRMDDFECVLAALVAPHRHTAAIVRYAERPVLEDSDLHERRVAGHCLIDRVVDYLPDEVVEAADVRRPDVHARASPDRIQTLEHLNALGVVLVGAGLLGLAGSRRFGRGARCSVVVAVGGFLRQELPPVRRSKRRENSSSL